MTTPHPSRAADLQLPTPEEFAWLMRALTAPGSAVLSEDHRVAAWGWALALRDLFGSLAAARLACSEAARFTRRTPDDAA